MYLPEEVNVCSLVTALADGAAMDGVELETLVDRAPLDYNTDTNLTHLTEEQRPQLMELLGEYKDISMTFLSWQSSMQPFTLILDSTPQ